MRVLNTTDGPLVIDGDGHQLAGRESIDVETVGGKRLRSLVKAGHLLVLDPPEWSDQLPAVGEADEDDDDDAPLEEPEAELDAPVEDEPETTPAGRRRGTTAPTPAPEA